MENGTLSEKFKKIDFFKSFVHVFRAANRRAERLGPVNEKGGNGSRRPMKTLGESQGKNRKRVRLSQGKMRNGSRQEKRSQRQQTQKREINMSGRIRTLH